jgi:AraC-like DNA-binding protein
MIFNLLIFLTGFLSLLASVVLLKKSFLFKINYFLFLLLIFAFLQRTFFILKTFGLISINLKYPTNIVLVISLIYFFFFKEFFTNKVKKLEVLIAIFLCLFLFILRPLGIINLLTNGVLVIIFITTLYVLALRIIIKTYSKHKKIANSKIDFKFGAMMFVLASFIMGSTFYVFIRNLIDNSIQMELFFILSSLGWLVILAYMFLNPEILFGRDKLMSIITNQSKTLVKVWSNTPLKKIKNNDSQLSLKVYKHLNSSIFTLQIITLENSLNLKDIEKLNLSDLLKIPQSHLDFIFDYHSHLSKLEFLNYLRILKSINLIKNGYLNNKSMSSLIQKSNFKSKTSFYRNFKKFTLLTTKEYILDLTEIFKPLTEELKTNDSNLNIKYPTFKRALI